MSGKRTSLDRAAQSGLSVSIDDLLSAIRGRLPKAAVSSNKDTHNVTLEIIHQAVRKHFPKMCNMVQEEADKYLAGMNEVKINEGYVKTLYTMVEKEFRSRIDKDVKAQLHAKLKVASQVDALMRDDSTAGRYRAQYMQESFHQVTLRACNHAEQDAAANRRSSLRRSQTSADITNEDLAGGFTSETIVTGGEVIELEYGDGSSRTVEEDIAVGRMRSLVKTALDSLEDRIAQLAAGLVRSLEKKYTRQQMLDDPVVHPLVSRKAMDLWVEKGQALVLSGAAKANIAEKETLEHLGRINPSEIVAERVTAAVRKQVNHGGAGALDQAPTALGLGSGSPISPGGGLGPRYSAAASRPTGPFWGKSPLPVTGYKTRDSGKGDGRDEVICLEGSDEEGGASSQHDVAGILSSRTHQTSMGSFTRPLPQRTEAARRSLDGRAGGQPPDLPQMTDERHHYSGNAGSQR